MNKSNSYNRVVGLQLGLTKSAGLPRGLLKLLARSNRFMDKNPEIRGAARLGAYGGGIGGTIQAGTNLEDILKRDSSDESADMDFTDKLKYVLGNDMASAIGKGGLAGSLVGGALGHTYRQLLRLQSYLLQA